MLKPIREVDWNADEERSVRKGGEDRRKRRKGEREGESEKKGRGVKRK